jgi:DNA-binding response OmpR family regulator
MKLLIIDDEAHIRTMMRLTLEAAGYQVDEAGTGEAGLALFGDGHAYGAVLLDQKMPGIDGLQTLQRLKDRLPGICVIMVTAFASIDLAVDAMRLGATDFLRKPMTPEALRAAVAAALGSRPRTPLPRPASPESGPDGHPGRHTGGRTGPRIETITLNGFRIERSRHAPGEPGGEPAGEHVFRVTHFPDGAEFQVTVTIDPEAVARVTRLSRRELEPTGAFWRAQAERMLSTHLWSEGQAPKDGRLVVGDISREDIELAAAWTLD